MKKITLVLCACAMAFAGLLVSCNNSTGDEQIILRGTTSYDYAYAVSGSKVVTTKDSRGSESSDFLDTTVVTDTFKNGVANLKWSVDDDETVSVQNYTLAVKYGYGDTETSTDYTGTYASTDPDKRYSNNHNLGTAVFKFYSLGDKFYDGESDRYAFDALTEDDEKAETYSYAITGKIAEDDTLKIVVTVKNYDYDDADAKTVDNKTTVYTFDLVKIGSAE